MSQNIDEEIVKALILEEQAALNEFKKRKSSTTSIEKKNSTPTSISSQREQLDLISFSAEAEAAQCSSTSYNSNQHYDKLKEKILKLNEIPQQQLIPYKTQIPPQQYYQQPPYNQYYSPNMYFSSPVQRGIGFENIVNTLNYSNNNNYAPNYYAAKPASAASSSYYYSSPNQSTSSSYYSAQATSPSLSLVPVQQQQQHQKQIQYQPQPAPAAITPAKPILALPSSSSSTASSTISNERNAVSSNNQKTPKTVDDLINLDVPDESIQLSNILQTFDPLTIKHSIDDDASSSYYADQDPFDYIYSGGTQYSDPLYEAINRNKPVTSSNNNVTAAETYNSTSRYEDEEIYNRNYGVEDPPPLPPRNSTYDSRNEQNYTMHGTTNKLYENIVEERKYNNDSLSFYKMVKELRAKYVSDDEESNVGHIKAAQLDSKYLKVSSIKLLVYPSVECFDNRSSNFYSTSESGYQKLDGYVQPVAFTCDVNSTVVHIIMQVLATLENELKGSPDKFVLKTIGLQEWLSDCNVTLSQLMYVHDCISMEKDVQLGLYPKLEKHLKVIARTRVDDNRDRDLKSENILPNDPVTSISYDSLIILLETLEMEIDRLESASTVQIQSSFNASGVVQACRAICSLFGSIDTFELYNALTSLKETCDEQLRNLQFTNYAHTKATIVSEKGNYAKVVLRPRSVNEEIKYRCNEIRDAILHLLEVYTQAFQVNYTIKRPHWNTAILSTTDVTENIMLHLMAIHRPQQSWKYDEYIMGIQIYHGTRFIGEPLIGQCSNSLDGFFPRLTFHTWMNFNEITVSMLPRESRIIFVLYGCNRVAVEGGAANTSTSEDTTNGGTNQELTKVELGWSSLQFFDYERKMIQGHYFLAMWPPSADKFLVPSPPRGAHPYADYCPILSIEIPSYGGTLYFPEIVPNMNVPRLDFLSLDGNLKEELMDTIEQGALHHHQLDKREVLWEKRFYLQCFPKALPKVLNAALSWDSSSLADLHGLICTWSPLKPLTSLELLLPRFPDMFVRAQAVKWIARMSEEELIDFLPQLTQALKFDCYDASPLSCFLLGRALDSPRVAHYLYWLLSQNLPGSTPQNDMESNPQNLDESDDAYVMLQYRFHRRNKLLLRALLAISGERLCKQFLSQNMLCKSLDDVANSVKNAKDSHRLSTLRRNVVTVHQILNENPTCLPLSPGMHVQGISAGTCSYWNSNTLPLKINFMGPDGIIPAIYKCGDDLQQDMLTLQIVRIIDKMWLKEGLDLKMVTFQCISTGRNRGMIEMVTNAETLRKIQVEWGLTGSFKDKPIAEWLQKMNENTLDYQRAVDNFTASCAGYSIITYLLGIGDRHNDNVLIQTSGHIFHIDFGKFLGDAQMFGNFRRDRTPFVLTSDMAYVINGGDKPSEKFHNFVDLCCSAFNIVRKNGDLLLHIFALMASSGIPGASEAVNYVRNALMPGASNPEASANFAKMIHVSLKSWFTQFNFFLHNLAQMRFAGSTGEGGEVLSFIPKTYTVTQDGFIEEVVVYGYQKRYDLEKRYCYILEVSRQHNPDKVYLFRTYKELSELHQKLCLLFPLARLHSLQNGISMGRSNIKTVAERRLPEVKKFIHDLMLSSREIINSDLVVTFFHPLLRDQQEADIRSTKMKEDPASSNNRNICGEIKFSIHYHRDTFIVMIHHARSLPMTTGGQEPNTYVKSYLIPDRSKITKRKTRVVKKSCFPSFMETLEYRMPLQVIKLKTLQITVWSHDSLQENEFLGGVQIPLNNINLKEEMVSWHRLVYLTRSH